MLRLLNRYKKLIKFMVVGGSGAILSMSLMYIFTSLLNIYYMVSYPMVFATVVCFNYYLNNKWTFIGYKSNGLMIFFAGRIVTLLINEGVLYVIVSILGIHYLIGTIVAILVSVSLNYKFSRSKVWKELKVIL